MMSSIHFAGSGLLFNTALQAYLGTAGLIAFVALIFVLGCCLGSFVNACAMRLVREEDFIFSASRCRACDRALRWHDNLPLLGFLKLRGRCQCRRTALSPRYIVIECLGGMILVGYGLTLPPVLALGFSIALVFVAISCLTDLESLTLHPALLTAFGSVGLALSLIADFNLIPWHLTSAQSLAGIVFAAAVPLLINALYRAFRGHNGFGEGDFWLLGAMGAWLGPIMGLGVFLAACWLGAIVGITMLLRRRATAMTRLPFGLYAGIAFILWPNFLMKLL
jgi:leader peptidase (prepilin peptidase)/N-methyltransferase